ncbi:TonB-dependent receptor [Massilia cavernae]|uniref:TonB-dependent receptor n=1 Tax=Massilia cavernae TaxID=2320864 RepID=A0A418XAA7_9BURK|nr:TonB-dependent receptor [Massilia cavernae]RJG09377.1 TonB-dependent receptor [Massilia cavernae]
MKKNIDRPNLTTRKTRLPMRLALASLILGAWTPWSVARQSPDSEMAMVYVSASRSQTRVEQMPLHTTIISQEQIRTSAVQTLDQLLRDVPGMNFSAVPAALSDPTGHQTRMRGLGNAKVLMLLDGMPMHDPFYLTTQWFKVPLSNVERVEILRGGNSSLWGNMAVAGVVNIVTKRPRANAGEVQASAGTAGTWSVAASRDLALSDTVRMNLAADVHHMEGYQGTPDAYRYRFPERQATTADNRNVSLTLHVQPDDTLRGYVRLGYHVQDQQISYRYGENLQRSPDIAVHVEKKLPNRTNVEANAWSQYVAFDKLNGNTCYYQGGTVCLTSTSAALTPQAATRDVIQFYSQQGRLRYRESGSSLLYSTRISPLIYAATAGVDFRRLSAEDTELFYNTPVSPAAPQGRFDNATTGHGVQTFHGVFGQIKLAPLDALDMTISARVDRYAIDDRDNRRTLASGVQTGGPLPAWDKTALDPSVAVRYSLGDSLSLRAAAYKAFRAPGFNNLTRTFGTGTSTTIANPNLTTENLRGWESGGDYRRGGFSLGATYFHYDIADMIATFTARSGAAPEYVQLICGGSKLPTCGGAARYYTNDQDGRAHGIEAVASWRRSRQLTVDGFVTRTRTYLTRRGSVVTDPLHEQLVGVPENIATLGATWSPTEAWRTRLQGRYTGPMSLDTTSVAGVRVRQGGYSVWDLSTEYRWSKAVALFFRATNLADRRYSENAYAASQAYNQTLSPPRTLSTGVRASF